MLIYVGLKVPAISAISRVLNPAVPRCTDRIWGDKVLTEVSLPYKLDHSAKIIRDIIVKNRDQKVFHLILDFHLNSKMYYRRFGFQIKR